MTVYGKMCLFTILMLNVRDVTIFMVTPWTVTPDKQVISPWLYYIYISCEE
jgi:hypothetical protein